MPAFLPVLTGLAAPALALDPPSTPPTVGTGVVGSSTWKDDWAPPLVGIDVPAVAGIVNGTNARPGEFPEVVVLVFVAYGSPFCSATLIDPDWLLTAGHCVFGFEQAFNDGQIAVVLDANLFSPDNPPALSAVFTAEGIVHPDYSGAADGTHDVALVRLASPILGVEPAVLNDEVPTDAWIGEEITFVGYGVTSDASYDSGLRRYADIPVLAVDPLVVYALDDSDPHQNVCFGDSGGAAFENTAAGLELAGVNSFVFALQAGELACADGGTGAARVDVHVPWILGYVPNVRLEPEGGDPDTGLPADPPEDTGNGEGSVKVDAPSWGEPARPSADQYPNVWGCTFAAPSLPHGGIPFVLIAAVVSLTRRPRRSYVAPPHMEA